MILSTYNQHCKSCSLPVNIYTVTHLLMPQEFKLLFLKKIVIHAGNREERRQFVSHRKAIHVLFEEITFRSLLGCEINQKMVWAQLPVWSTLLGWSKLVDEKHLTTETHFALLLQVVRCRKSDESSSLENLWISTCTYKDFIFLCQEIAFNGISYFLPCDNNKDDD